MSTPLSPFPFELGARTDYGARIAVRAAAGLADGAALVVNLEGGPLTFRRTGAAFQLTAPGQPDRTLPADALPAVVWAAMVTHASIQAAAHQAAAAGAVAASGKPRKLRTVGTPMNGRATS